MNFFKSIRGRLMAIFILVIVLPTALTARVGMMVFLGTMETERNRLSEESATQANQIIFQQTQLAEEIGRHLANLPLIHLSTTHELTLLLENCRDIWPLAEISIFNGKRSLLAHSPGITPSPDHSSAPFESDILTQALHLEIVSDIFRTSEGLSIQSAVPIVNMATLEAVGAILVSIPIQSPLLQTIRLATHSHVSIQWDSSGQLATTMTDSQAQPFRDWPSPSIFETREPFGHRLESIQGQLYAVSYMPLTNKDGHKLGVLSTAVDLKNFEITQKKGLTVLAIATSLALIAAVAVALFTSMAFTRPLSRLSKAIKSVAQGNLETRAQEERNDEFGILAASFNRMTESLEDNQKQILEYSQKLKKSNEELANFNQELENMVGQRTQDLAKSNDELKAEIHKKQLTEIMLKEARRNAEEANKAKTAFLASMSHEIRTPLNVIVGMADYMLAGKLIPEQRDYLELVKLSADHLLMVINDLLDYSKIEVGKMVIEHRACNLKQLLDSCLFFVRELAKRKGLEILLETEDDLPPFILADPVRLKQILLNLLTNAIKFTEKGQVALQAKTITGNPSGIPSYHADSICLQFSVKDTGIGIPEKFLNTVFQSFTQADGSTSRRAGGVGLGLAIVKGLADAMGGTIEVESSVGIGSVFSFRCCFSSTDETQVDQETDIPMLYSDLSVGQGLILIVEDNPLNIRTATLLLSRLGVSSEAVSNGREALNTLANKRYDLVLLDLEMPEMDGMETSRLIRQGGDSLSKVLDPDVPIVAMTAHALADIKEQCLQAGMNGFLAKPITLASLNKIFGTFVKPGLSATMPIPSATDTTLDSKAALKLIEDPDILKEIISMFHRELPQIREDIETAVYEENIQYLKDITHKLKSDAATIGAVTVGRLAREIHNLAKDTPPENTLAMGRELLAELETLSVVMNDLQSKEQI